MHRVLLGVHAQHTAICASRRIIHVHCGVVLLAANVADVLRLPACTSHAHSQSVFRVMGQVWEDVMQTNVDEMSSHKNAMPIIGACAR